MPPRTKTRLKAVAAQTVPQTRDEVAQLIAEIGIDSRELDVLQAEMNDELARIKKRWEQRAEPARERIETAQRGVQAYCEANRETLTQHGRTKTHSFPTGDVSWRTRPPSVRITGEESVRDALQRLRLDRFLRTKTEINKEAILNEPEAVALIPGIKISQIEDFVVTPFEAELTPPEAA
jgi:phage host-nuclease inhibitor protein Gam